MIKRLFSLAKTLVKRLRDKSFKYLECNLHKYLGLQAVIEKFGTKPFKTTKDIIWNKMNNWKVKLLPQAKNEIHYVKT
jgi:hypothetical protein